MKSPQTAFRGGLHIPTKALVQTEHSRACEGGSLESRSEAQQPCAALDEHGHRRRPPAHDEFRIPGAAAPHDVVAAATLKMALQTPHHAGSLNVVRGRLATMNVAVKCLLSIRPPLTGVRL